jgi:hypothetical protein
MNFSWQTSKREVLDSITSWGFTFNADKQRWDKGMLNGYRCNKLKVWFNDKDLFEGVEAKYQDLDTATSRMILEHYVEQTRAKHGKPTFITSDNGPVKLSRYGWRFSDANDPAHDMIVIAGFEDYVLFHAARNMPPLFDVQTSIEE